MRLRKQYLTQNDCFRQGRSLWVRGVMVHSTGANNPRVARYVPGDGEMGLNTAGNHWNRPGLTKCVHAFIGRFADGGVGTVQTLPWDRKGWHSGSGSKPVSANSTHIGFEICEDSLTDPCYFRSVYREAAELTAMLCEKFGLDPLADGVVICHAEGHKMGIASNHGDVLHWFPRHGRSMDNFRADVARIMRGEDEEVTYEQWKEYMDRYRRELGGRTVPDWGRAELEQAKKLGLTDGSRPLDLATRQEVVSMVIRAKNYSNMQNR